MGDQERDGLVDYRLAQLDNRLDSMAGALEKLVETMTKLVQLDTVQQEQGRHLIQLTNRFSNTEKEIQNITVTLAENSWVTKLATKVAATAAVAVVTALLALILVK